MTQAASFILRSAAQRPQSTLASLKGERRQNIFLKPEVHLFPNSNSPMLRWDRGSVFFLESEWGGMRPPLFRF